MPPAVPRPGRRALDTMTACGAWPFVIADGTVTQAKNRRPRASGRRSPDAPRGAQAAPPAADEAPAVGAHLRRLRVSRRWSLERLAQVSGVSRAMLCQIELGQSAPTINVLWRIARALDVPFSALLAPEGERRVRVLEAAQGKVLSSADGRFSSRALFPFDEPRRVEFYELRLAAGAEERAEAHPAGTTENLVVGRGRLQVEVEGRTHDLRTGDALLFAADVPHVYRNPGIREAVMYLVMTYAGGAPG